MQWPVHATGGRIITAALALLIPGIWPLTFNVTWYWVLLFYLIFFGFPMALTCEGKSSYFPLWIGIGMVLLSHKLSSGEPWQTSWHEWFLAWFGVAGVMWGIMLWLPVMALFLGCHSAQAVRRLAFAVRTKSGGPDPAEAGPQLVLAGVFYGVVNLVLLLWAVETSRWLRDHEIWPFQNGFWNVSTVTPPAPAVLNQLLAGPWSPLTVLLVATLVLAGTVAVCWRARQLEAVRSFGLLCFIVIGFPSYWVVYSRTVEYKVLGMGMWD